MGNPQSYDDSSDAQGQIRPLGEVLLREPQTLALPFEGRFMKDRRSQPLLTKIVRGIASGESTEQIIGRTVHLISLDFPAFRIAYSTIDEQGGMTVVDSVEPPGMPKIAGLTGDLTVASQYLRELREGRPVIIEDTTKDPRTAPLSDKMESGSTLALVDVPLAHSDRLVGLLCFDSPKPREWADDEIALLPEVAEYLSIALRDAHLQQALDEADEEARVTSLRLHTVIEGLQIGILLEDNARRVLYANSKFCEMFSIASAGTVIGANSRQVVTQWRDLFPEDYLVRIDEIVRQQRVVRTETLKAADGRTFERDYIPIRSTGLIAGGLWVYQEVTDRELLKEELLHAQKMESIGRLVGGVAHDFGNMLTPIMIHSELLARTIPPESPRQEHLVEIRMAAERSADLISRLLAFSRRQIPEPRVYSLNDLIINMHALLRRLIGEDIELVTLPTPGLGVVEVDPAQFEQVLANLAVNARDAMPEGGRLVIDTADVHIGDEGAGRHPEVPPGEYVTLTVSDTGTGMTEEVKARAFEPFFTTKEVGKGTGLGQSTCHGIVTESGGHMVVDSGPGQGTTVTIYLPKAHEPASPVPSTDQSAYLPRGYETVMVVEDEPAIRRVIADVLRTQGYNVLVASNGLDALAAARDHADDRIHLLLADLVMPLMGGQEFTRRFRAIHPEAKVLYTSGYHDDAIVHHGGFEADAGFMRKPFTQAVLANRVRELLDRKAQDDRP